MSAHKFEEKEEGRGDLLPPPVLPSEARVLAVLDLVLCERLRQNALVESGVLPFNCASAERCLGEKLMVLGEEFGEVSRACYEAEFIGSALDASLQLEHLRTELVQLSAVAAAWAESLGKAPSTNIQHPDKEQ